MPDKADFGFERRSALKAIADADVSQAALRGNQQLEGFPLSTRHRYAPGRLAFGGLGVNEYFSDCRFKGQVDGFASGPQEWRENRQKRDFP
jgi:hypothetical protein